MRKQLLAGSAALALAAVINGPAGAADMPVKAPMAPAIFNWTGFYVGGHIGWGSGKFASELSQPGEDRRGKGAVGGLQLGYNYQNGRVVWGWEADISGASLNTNISDNHFGVDVLGSLRGRLGLAMDRVLVYATGGWAYTHGKIASSALNNTHYTKGKPVVGAGIEWAAANNLTYRVEVLDYLGKTNIGGEESGGNKLKDIWVARVGFNYKFDSWGKGPVVAKY